MSKSHLFIFFLFLSPILCFGQKYNLGVPIIQSFPKEIVNAGAQFWDIDQDQFGRMYYANNDGLVTFDGSMWKTYPLPNFTIVRSIGVVESGVVYAGGQNEFGRFKIDDKGDWKYESLKHLMPDGYQTFGDIWKIEVLKEGILFIASDALFLFKEEKIKGYYNGTFTNIGKINDLVFVQDIFTGLYIFKNENLEKIAGTEFFIEKGVEAIIPDNENFIIATINDNLFKLKNGNVIPWETEAGKTIKGNLIYDVTLISADRIAIATSYSGLFIINKEGQIIYHVHKGNGLLNNNAFSLFEDKSRNLWLGLSNGLSYVQVNSPFTKIFPDPEHEAIGFEVKIVGDKIYYATNKGLYFNDWKEHYKPEESNNNRLINNTKGQVWGLDMANNQLIATHGSGAFLIENEKAKRFYDQEGIWQFQSLKNKSNQYITGSYSTLSVFEKDGNDFKFKKSLTDINESCRFIEQDEKGNIWVAHPYRGIFKINPSENFDNAKVDLLGQKEGLPSYNLNHLFKINNEIIFCGETGIYNYSYDKDRFILDSTFNDFFEKNTKIRRLQETPDGNIWFVTKDELGILKVSDKGLDKEINKIVFPFSSRQLNQGFESIYPYDQDNVFITNDKGFTHYSPSNYIEEDFNFFVVLNEVKITSDGDSIISKGFFKKENTVSLQQSENQIYTFPHYLHDFFFKFSATDFVGMKSIKYRYYLEGYETDWSDWQKENIKEYTNLAPGKYTLHLQAKNISNTTSQTLTYSFKISAAWYQSTLAYIIYGLLLLFGLSMIVRNYRKKYFGLQEENKQVVKESNEAIGKLKAEKIENELAYKQRELISTTLNLVKKNETISNIKNRLNDIKKSVKEKEPHAEIERLIKKLHLEEVQDENWEQVMFHFNQLNRGFFDKLKEEFPTLTPKDLKMCAYLRMNLSTKEMTSLLNVTTRGVEASRYRIRKKFQLKKEQNLTEFLMGF